LNVAGDCEGFKITIEIFVGGRVEFGTIIPIDENLANATELF